MMGRITIKNAADIEKMKAAGNIVKEALDLLSEKAAIGMTTDELDRMAEAYIRSKGAYPSFLNYSGYPKSICTSVNQQVFHGDAARTVLIGNVPEAVQKLVEVTRECFFEALKFARPGYHISDIGAAVQKHAEKHGYGVVRDLVGHGIGREMHEPPDVPNFTDRRMGRGAKLVPGMVIAIEPMINMGTWEVVQLQDGWTIETRDGKPSAHYENTVAITEGEPLLLTL